MKIYIFSEFYSEDLTSSGYYITEIAQNYALTHDVTVITTSKVNKTATLIENGVNIKRISIQNFNKFNLLKRALAFLNICQLFYKEALKLDIDKESHVIAVTNPALFIPFIAYLKSSLKFKLTIFVHDVFPESLVATKVLSSYNPFYLVLLKIFNKSYKIADQIVVCGRDMEMLFKRKLKIYNGNLKFIPNWADGNLIYPIKKKMGTNRNDAIPNHL